MTATASQITTLRLFTQPFIPGADQKKHQSSASLAFVRGIHRWPVNSPLKGPVTRKMFPFDDVIMRNCHNPNRTKHNKALYMFDLIIWIFRVKISFLCPIRFQMIRFAHYSYATRALWRHKSRRLYCLFNMLSRNSVDWNFKHVLEFSSFSDFHLVIEVDPLSILLIIPLCGEFTDDRWIPRKFPAQRASNADNVSI